MPSVDIESMKHEANDPNHRYQEMVLVQRLQLRLIDFPAAANSALNLFVDAQVNRLLDKSLPIKNSAEM